MPRNRPGTFPLGGTVWEAQYRSPVQLQASHRASLHVAMGVMYQVLQGSK